LIRRPHSSMLSTNNSYCSQGTHSRRREHGRFHRASVGRAQNSALPWPPAARWSW
jgi:hypothetical protein